MPAVDSSHPRKHLRILGACVGVIGILGWTLARGWASEESPWIPALAPPAIGGSSTAGAAAATPPGHGALAGPWLGPTPGEAPSDVPGGPPGGGRAGAPPVTPGTAPGPTPEGATDPRIPSLRAAWLDFERGEAPYAARTLLEESLAVALEPATGGPEEHLDALRAGTAFVLRGRVYTPDPGTQGAYHELRRALEQTDLLEGSLVTRIRDHGRGAFGALGVPVPDPTGSRDAGQGPR